MREIQIENKTIGLDYPTYFVADVAANHDGDLERAKDLIYLCADAGADAAKFQNFLAKTIVSDRALIGRPAFESRIHEGVSPQTKADAIRPSGVLRTTSARCDGATL